MTNQELYTKVRNHLLKQNAKAMLDGCAYRGEGGFKCAIGCLIPDSLYKESFEDNNVTHPSVVLAAGLYPENLDLARDLQFVHDLYPPIEWQLKLDGVADQYKLKVEDIHDDIQTT